MKRCIEDRHDNDVTWDSPFVELHYPVEWNWKAPESRDAFSITRVSGKITTRNTASEKVAQKTLTEIMVRHLNSMALLDLTNHAWWEKRNNYYTPFLPVELGKGLMAIPKKRLRREAFEQLFRPFSVGAALIDYGGMEFRSGARVPKRIVKQLAKIDDFIDIQEIRFSGDVNGRKFDASLAFQIHPAIVDYDAKKAYQPLSVGLFFEPRIVDNDIVITTPSEWPLRDRKALWDELLHKADELVNQLVPRSESKGSVILSINADLEIPLSHSGLDVINTVVQKTLRTLTEAGPVLKFHHEIADGRESAVASSGQSLAQLSRLVEKASTPDEKGRTLENLVEGLLQTIAGFEIQNRVRTQTEEIDFTVANGSNDTRLKREQAIVLVECKNWSSTCGKNEFVAFREKMRNRSERCTLGLLISWNGFAGTVTKEMLRGSHERLLILPIDGTQIREAVREGSFLRTIRLAWDKATMI